MVVRILKDLPPGHPMYSSVILRHSQHWDPKSKGVKPAGQSDGDKPPPSEERDE